jgi:hypothetical protein
MLFGERQEWPSSSRSVMCVASRAVPAAWSRSAPAGRRSRRRAPTVGADGAPEVMPVVFTVAMSGESTTVYTAVDAMRKSTHRLRRLANTRSRSIASLRCSSRARLRASLEHGRLQRSEDGRCRPSRNDVPSVQPFCSACAVVVANTSSLFNPDSSRCLIVVKNRAASAPSTIRWS